MSNIIHLSDYRKPAIDLTAWDKAYAEAYHMMEREKELIKQTRKVDDLDERLEQLIDEMTEE